jgi:hypothetical protein
MATVRKRGRTLATNVYIDGRWYGPSYPDKEAPDGVDLPESAFDVRENWPTADDAARVGLAYGPPSRSGAVHVGDISGEGGSDGA